MATLWEKLNWKGGEALTVVNAPASFESSLAELVDAKVGRKADGKALIHFAMAFVTKQSEVDAITPKLTARAEGDAILWFAYPKGTSKKLKCDFNRDTGWAVLERAGWETVRAVAIDEDWTALRFRRSEFVKSRK